MDEHEPYCTTCHAVNAYRRKGISTLHALIVWAIWASATAITTLVMFDNLLLGMTLFIAWSAFVALYVLCTICTYACIVCGDVGRPTTKAYENAMREARKHEAKQRSAELAARLKAEQRDRDVHQEPRTP